MILEVASLHVRPGQADAFEAAFRRARAIISSMQRCVSHELQRCIERSDEYVLLVAGTRWRPRGRFRQSAQYREWRRLLHHFYEPFPVVSRYRPVQDAAG